MKAIGLFSCVILFSLTVRSQNQLVTVFGHISDAESGEYLSGAHVISGSTGTISNDYGFYSLQLQTGDHLLEFQYLGYQTITKEILLSANTRIDIRMTPGIEIEEVSVSGKRKQQYLIEESEIGQYRIHAKKLERLPFFVGEADIMKSLQLLPGISVGAEGSSNVDIRGGSSDQNLVLLDEVPVYNQNHAFGLVSVFNNDAIKEARIFKGGVSSKYGGRLSGVSSIWMKEGNLIKHKQSLTLSTIAGSVILEGPIKKGKSSYMISGRRSFLDLLYSGVMLLSNTKGTQPGFSFYDVNAKLNFKLKEKHHLFWSLYVGRDKFFMKNKESGEKYNLSFGWGNITSSLRLNSVLSEKMFSNFTLYYSFLDNNQKNVIETNEFKSVNTLTSKTNEYGAKVSFDYTINSIQKLQFGLNTSIQYFNPVVMKWDDPAQHYTTSGNQFLLFSFSPYIEDRISLGKFVITPGLRAAYFNNNESAYFRLEPRLNISMHLDPSNTFMAGFTTMNQPIFQLYNSVYGWPVDFWLPYWSNLQPSHSWQVSAGWKRKLFTGSTLTLEGYYKKMTNLIYVDQPVEDFVSSDDNYRLNILSGVSYGIELLYQFDYNILNGWLSYTYSRSLRSFDSDPTNKCFPFQYDRPHYLNLVLNYNFRNNKEIKRYISSNLNFRSGIPYLLSTQYFPGNSPPLFQNGYYYNFQNLEYFPKTANTRMKNYFRVDISYSSEKKIKNGSRTWNFSILNLTNTQNPYMIYRDNNDGKLKQLVLFPIMPAISYKRTF